MKVLSRPLSRDKGERLLITMSDTTATFKKVIAGILSYEVNSHPWRALLNNDTLDIEGFLAFEEDDIKQLTYMNEQEEPV